MMIWLLTCSKRWGGGGDMYSDMYEISLDMQIDMLGYTYNEHIITKNHDTFLHFDMYTYIQ